MGRVCISVGDWNFTKILCKLENGSCLNSFGINHGNINCFIKNSMINYLIINNFIRVLSFIIDFFCRNEIDFVIIIFYIRLLYSLFFFVINLE